MRIPKPWPGLNRDDPYWKFVNFLGVTDTSALKVAFVIQGGGAKGAWQGGVLNTLLNDPTIVPVATMGSSAGAINSALVSSKMRDRNADPFAVAWRRLRWFVRRRCTTLARGAYRHLRPEDGIGRRRVHQFSNQLLVDAVTRALGDWTCALYTYVQACDVNGGLPLQARYPRSPLYRLEAWPRDRAFATNRSRNQLTPLQSVEAPIALAASACLPLIEPLSVNGVLLMDGGIMSNLPMEFAASSPNIGAHLVLLLLPKKLSLLSPKGSFVDWNVVAALAAVQAKLGPEDNFVYCVVEPSRGLLSGTVPGFLCPGLQRLDAAAGSRVARQLLKDVEEFLRSPRKNVARLRKYDLRHRTLPEIPPTPPLHSWMAYANRSWTA